MTETNTLFFAKNKGIFFILISTCCFAVVNLIVKYLGHLPAHELILFRSFVSLVICVYGLRKLNLPIFGNNKKWLLIRGISGVIALTMFFFTLQEMPLANAVTIQYTSPLFTALLGIFLLKEPVKWIQWLFYAIALAGIFIIKGFDNRVEWPYLILGILSSAFAGLAYNAVRRLKDTEHPLQVVLYFPLVSTPIMVVWSLFDWVMPQNWEWLLLIIMGVFTQIAQIYMTRALHADKAARVTPFKYFGAIFAILIGYTVFDEKLYLFNYVGIALIIAGVLLNSLVKSK